MVKVNLKKVVGSIIFLCCIHTVANAAVINYPIRFTNNTSDSNPQCMGYAVSVTPTNGSVSGNVSSSQSVEIDYTNQTFYSLEVKIYQNPGKCESSPSNLVATFSVDTAEPAPPSCTGTGCKAIQVSTPPTYAPDQGFTFTLSNS